MIGDPAPPVASREREVPASRSPTASIATARRTPSRAARAVACGTLADGAAQSLALRLAGDAPEARLDAVDHDLDVLLRCAA